MFSEKQEKICIKCGAQYVPHVDVQKRCKPCSTLKSKKKPIPFEIKKCECCGLEFQSKTLRVRYCSAKCQQRAKYEINRYNPAKLQKAFEQQRKRNAAEPEKYAAIKAKWHSEHPEKTLVYQIREKEKKASDVDHRRSKQSVEHIAKRIAKMAETLAQSVRQCIKCKSSFTPTNGAQKYCSGQCWNAVARKKKKLLPRITIPKQEYAALLKKQGGKCGICFVEARVNARQERFAVDHCHGSGKIRGLLCHKCNTALGLFKDSPAALQAAIDYLKDV